MNYSGNVITKNPVQPSLTSAPGVWSLQEAQNAVANGTWPIPGVINPISKSLRFNSADSAYLNRTPAVAGNRKTWTFSAWVKRSLLSSGTQMLFSAGAASQTSNRVALALLSGDSIWYRISVGGVDKTLQTTSLYRDASAWYHIVVNCDTTQATAANRTAIYVNGVQVTAFSTEERPDQNADTAANNTVLQGIGASSYSTGGFSDSFFSGYLTEINFIDGQALTPSAFGLTDPNTGVWVPKKYTGTYGTNGFYLNFSDSNSTTLLGYDYSGNGNNWTPNNFSVTTGAGNDSLTDVPTLWTPYSVTSDTGGVVRGNYATLNPLAGSTVGTITYSNGNLDVRLDRSVADCWVVGSITIPTSGKWYFEFIPTNSNSGSIGYFSLGLSASTINRTSSSPVNPKLIRLWNGDKDDNGSISTYGSGYVFNDVCGVAIDMDNYKMWFSKNGTWQASGNPTTGTNAAFTNLNVSVPWYVWIGAQGNNTNDGNINFGQRPFAYTPPSGYKSLCTTNLPTPTIGAASTTLAGNYFNTVLYTGTGSALGVTGVGFQPDFVWIKSRSAATDHALYDAVRGVQKQLESNTTDAETTETQGLTAFDTNGFNLGTLAQVNTVNATYVGWNWKAGSSNITNTSGTITSTVSANTTAGFSIVGFTGNTAADQTIGHGLGVAPSFIIVKSRTGTALNWTIYHQSLGINKVMVFTTDAEISLSGYWGTSNPTSTVFGVKGGGYDNNANTTMIAYCFAAVAGYSAFGSYTGNGSTDGPFIYTGFRPRYIMIKRTDTSGTSWVIFDTARNLFNSSGKALWADLADAESTYSDFDILSNGFKLRFTSSTGNASGGTYVYAAFAESPFKFANAR